MTNLPRLSAIAIALLVSVAPGFAGNFSFTGSFTHDNDVQLFNLNLSADGAITLQTLGYGGGTNANGNLVIPGGFEPILQVYNAGGTAVGGEIDPGPGGGACAPRLPDPNRDNFCQDAYQSGIVLTAGSYIIALTQSPNTPNGNLSDGFFYDGVANQDFNNGFVGTFGFQGTSNWALDILGATSASPQTAAPEPNSALLAAAAILLARFGGRRARSGKLS